MTQQDDARYSQHTVHYVACQDCPLYRYADDAADAEERAELHEEFHDGSHDAYADCIDMREIDTEEAMPNRYV